MGVATLTINNNTTKFHSLLDEVFFSKYSFIAKLLLEEKNKTEKVIIGSGNLSCEVSVRESTYLELLACRMTSSFLLLFP